jgi:group I intron endonuclease
MYNKISAVYQIVNTVTNDRYVGSSKDVYHRCANHKCPSTWEKCPNSPMYQDMQKYGLDKFRFQILAPVMPEYLKQVEQEFIEMVQPTYNSNRANGWNVERCKEAQKKYKRKYNNQLCYYNDETLTLNALYLRFKKDGIEHPNIEARKYIITN